MLPGTYTFYNEAAKQYLSFHDRKLILSAKPTPWSLKDSGRNGFYVYAHGTQLLLDIDNAWIQPGTCVKIWEFTGYDAQVWTISENPDGTCSFAHSADNRFCLGFEGGNPRLQIRNRKNPLQQWKALCTCGTEPKEYLSFSSKGRKVQLQLPPDITRVISAARLQRWADQLESAYLCYGELTGFLPFSSIVVEGYLPAPRPGHAGWVVPKDNRIHIDRAFLRKDLAKMALRRSDWNFCALHEMSHMFDFGMPWNFEPELMADLKLAYVMEKQQAAAAPAEFGTFSCFKGADIGRAYALLGKDFTREYNIFGCASFFLKIQAQIGWEPFRNTFHLLHQNQSAYPCLSGQERFLLFIRILSRCSGRNIQSFFSAAQWNVLMQQANQCR